MAATSACSRPPDERQAQRVQPSNGTGRPTGSRRADETMPLRLSEQFVLPGFGHRLGDVGMHEFLRSERSDSRSLDERQAAVRRRESASGAHSGERPA
jgi:hypothetical protein